MCYGKGIASLAEDIGKSVEEAQVVYDKIMQCFPGLLRLMEESQQCAREKGYVETIWGRRRHLPDMQLAKYSITCKDSIYFDPFFDSEELGVVSKLEARKQYWISQLDSCKYSSQKMKIRENAAKEGFTIKDNGRFISQATRQCVNCVDDQTEILTKQGWKTVYDLKEDDIVQTYNIHTCELEWQPILHINTYNGMFDVVHVKTRDIDCVCTKEHKFVTISNHNTKLIEVVDIQNIITPVVDYSGNLVQSVVDKQDIYAIDPIDFVWCPTTPNGTWLAKRNGTIFVTGNSRVQGSAADQTKIACNLIGRDELLKQNDFRILLLVHDEIIGECPAVNAKVCASRLSDLMIQAAKDICVPSKCDVEVSDCWYGESLNVDELCS